MTLIFTPTLLSEISSHLNFTFSKNTAKAYTRDITYFYNYCLQEQASLESINITQMRSFLQSRLLTVTHRSNRRLLSALSYLFNYLRSYHRLENMPLLGLKQPKLKQFLPTLISYHSFCDIITYLENRKYQQAWIRHRDIALLYLLYATGMRIGEALALPISILHQKLICILSKGNKERTIPLVPIVHKYLQEYVSKACTIEAVTTPSQGRGSPSLDAPLFIGLRGKRLSLSVVERLFDELSLVFGQNMFPHALRHSFATELLNSGVDISIVQELLGHKNILSTQVYLHTQLDYVLEFGIKHHPRSLKP